jgi:hypothetical protein
MECRIRTLTTARDCVETRPAASLPQRNAAEDDTRMTMTCMTSFATEMHTTRLKIGAKSENALNRNDTTRGIMIIMVPSTTNLSDNALPKERTMKEESKLFPTT